MNKQICLNRSVLDFMESKIDSFSTVIEIGGGWSSRWFADRCQRLLVIETNREWADKIADDLVGVNCAYTVHIPNMTEYLSSAQRHISGMMPPEIADLILIDCAEMYRNVSTHIVLPFLKPGGWILFDDAQRERHIDAIHFLTKVFGDPIRLEWQDGDIKSAKQRLTLAWQKGL